MKFYIHIIDDKYCDGWSYYDVEKKATRNQLKIPF